jgi:hypothetical protein
MNAYIKRVERYQINNLMLHLKLLGKQDQTKTKTSRRTEIITIIVVAKLIKQRPKNYTKNHETKSWFFAKINKIDKPLANLTKMRREKTQI